jgi:hypothetical protein
MGLALRKSIVELESACRVAAKAGLVLLRKSGHDVSDEPRDKHGKWTKGGKFSIEDEFRNDLKQYFNNTLPKSRRYLDVTKPSSKLREAGVTGSMVTLKCSTIRRKNRRDDDHEYTYENLKDLPEAVNNPIMVFEHDNGNKDIITTIQINGRNALVGLETVNAGKDTVVEKVATIFGKKSETIFEWIKSGKKFWYDKQKAHEWLSFHQGTNRLDYPTTIEPSVSSIPFLPNTDNKNIIKALTEHHIRQDQLRKSSGSGLYLIKSRR